jgi:sugar/nucleoside kinase (ribokinase family)
MKSLQPISHEGLLYERVIGTGGIGSGMFFSLQGNETLGREESRMAHLLPYKDYCKQHIIMHYISVLLGAETNGKFRSFPIGKVGNDETGKNLVKQMQAAGMTTDHIKISAEHATMFSVCFQYPDHAGGNITTAESASSAVMPQDVDEFFAVNDDNIKEIILAAPEVPVQTRIRLLEYGKKRGSLNVASLQSAEIAEFMNLNGFVLADVLFINLDEAKHIAHAANDTGAETVVLNAIRNLITINPDLTVFITCGVAGVYCYSKKHLEFFPSLNVDVVSTAGAGDAFLAGTIAGICCGLPLFKKSKDHAAVINTATELGVLVAAISVTAQDSIHMALNADYILNFIQQKQLHCSDDFLKVFGTRNTMI